MPRLSAQQWDDLIEKYLTRAAVAAGGVAASIGGIYLALDTSGALLAAGGQASVMRTNTALCLALCGGALVLAAPRESGKRRRRIAGTLASLVLLVTGLTLVEHLFGVELGIDQFLTVERSDAPHPSRMRLSATVGLAFGSAAILFLLRRKRRSVLAAQSLAASTCLIALLGILTYLYRLEHLYSTITWETGAALFLLGLGILLARPREAWMASFTSRTPGGVAVRRMIIPAILLPVLMGWLLLQAEFKGVLKIASGMSILVIAWIVIFTLLVYQIAKRAEAQQTAEEERLNRETLRWSEERLRSIIDNLAEGLVVVEPQRGTLHWNRRALNMHGYDPEKDEVSFLEPVMDDFELANLDGSALSVEQWPVNRILRGEELRDAEFFVRNKKRAWQRIYSYSGVLIRDAQGEAELAVVGMRDVTAEKEAADALRRSEELLRSVLEALPVAVWIIAADGRVLQANRAAEKIWGGPPRMTADRYGFFNAWWLHSGERIRKEEWGGARAIARGESSLDEEIEIESFDGVRKVILNSAIPILNRKGEITGAITVNQDITLRKRAENALRESEEKFRAVFQQAAVGMGRVSFTDARWIDVNDAFCSMLGYSREEMLATPWPAMTHPEDVDLDLAPFRQMMQGELENYSVEKRFIHRDGHQVWARLTLSLVRDRNGEPDFEIAIIEDVTPRKEAEEALRKVNDELELRVRERTRELEEAYAALQRETGQRLAAVEDLKEKEQLLVQQSRLAAMGEMLGNIAHQWRQPLNILGLLIQKLQLTYELGQFSGEFLKTEVAQGMRLVNHMSHTIDDFKDFLKAEKEKQEFSINGAVVTTVSLLEAPLKSMQVELVINQREELVITGHRNEFSHVIMNLVNNARDALREREVAAPRIVIELFREGGKAVVTVADNAGGIPDEILPRVFEPYFSTKGPEKGTGIGLYMSKSIVEKSMGGRLSVRNTAEGAEFRIEF